MELGKESVDLKIQDIPKKRLKLYLTKKNRFAYIQKETSVYREKKYPYDCFMVSSIQ